MLNLEEDKTALKVLVADTNDDLIRTNSEEAIDHLNLEMVRMTPPHFCLQNKKIDGPVRYVRDTENICLTVDQTNYIYKKV